MRDHLARVAVVIDEDDLAALAQRLAERTHCHAATDRPRAQRNGGEMGSTAEAGLPASRRTEGERVLEVMIHVEYDREVCFEAAARWECSRFGIAPPDGDVGESVPSGPPVQKGDEPRRELDGKLRAGSRVGGARVLETRSINPDRARYARVGVSDCAPLARPGRQSARGSRAADQCRRQRRSQLRRG